MERNPAFPTTQSDVRESPLATNKVLRNTYLLLSATLAFSASRRVSPSPLVCRIRACSSRLSRYFGLLYAVHKTANSAWGLLSVFRADRFHGLHPRTDHRLST